jgi:hypothetical protein
MIEYRAKAKSVHLSKEITGTKATTMNICPGEDGFFSLEIIHNTRTRPRIWK